MKRPMSLFPAKVVGALFLLLILTIVEVLIFANFYRGDLSFAAISLLGAGTVFLLIQILFSSGLEKETIAVWDYVVTLIGTVAALIFVLGGVSSMGDIFGRDTLPNLEARLDDAIRVYAHFQSDYCAARITARLHRSIHSRDRRAQRSSGTLSNLAAVPRKMRMQYWCPSIPR